MNYNQNCRLNQITEKTLIVGIDVSKNFHVARAQDFRGIEFGKPITFDNNYEGVKKLECWMVQLIEEQQKEKLIVGMEPTGPYWINLARYLREKETVVVTVNPMHVKKIKELDDNSQTKTDIKDAKIIAQLVKDGRYSAPNLLESVYEDLRNAKNLRRIMLKDLARAKNQIHNWLDRYFPEYKEAYKSWESKSFIKIIKKYTFPNVLNQHNANEIYGFLPPRLRQGVGINKIMKLLEASKKSIGTVEGLIMAKEEIKYLLKKYEEILEEIGKIDDKTEKICSELSEAKKMMEIKGIGLTTASGVIGEFGDIKKYKNSKQLIKMAGLSLVENSSGKHKGKVTISKRGRKDVRKFLYQVVFGMISTNAGFKKLYKYYTERAKNQLTGKQAIIALARKLLRIIHALITKDEQYDEKKMLAEIRHPEEFLITAA